MRPPVGIGGSAEALPVLGGSDAQRTEERTPKGLARSEAARTRHRIDAVRRLLEPAPGRFHPGPLHEPGRGRAGLRAEDAGEVAGAHRGSGCEAFDGQVLVEMIGDPGLHLGHRVAVGQLDLEVGAELRLPARAA